MRTSKVMSESELRLLWEESRFEDLPLHTTDGKPIQILYPGSPNADSGPDFLRASIRVGGTLYSGDVEIHIDAASWYGHGHHTDPHYNRVILHVALKSGSTEEPARTRSNRRIPLLVLSDLPGFPHLGPRRLTTGTGWAMLPCRRWNAALPRGNIGWWIRRLSRERLSEKTARFSARLNELADEQQPGRYGRDDLERTWRELAVKGAWDQLLYEGIMECLGYSKNRRPMLRLARGMRLEVLRRAGLDNRHAMESMLLGAAGLLPSSRGLLQKEARVYVRCLRRAWKKLRSGYRGPVLHEAEWLFFRLRPANFPTARLAALAALLPILFDGGFWRLVEVMHADGSTPRMQLRTVAALFTIHPEGFWCTHLHFRSAPHRGPANAPPERGAARTIRRARRKGVSLGRKRVLDIIVNAIIPLLFLYARLFEDRLTCRRVFRLYAALPLLQENTITRRMRRNLIPVRGGRDQQGMLQLHARYCTRNRCAECVLGPFGEIGPRGGAAGDTDD